MFNNKFSQFNSLTLLKSMRPRRAIVPDTPDFANFYSYSPDLNRLANFGLEMMKFLPRFEQLMYADDIYMDEGEEGSVTFEHGDSSTTVSQEWWDAFNQYEIGSSDGYHAFEGKPALTDRDGDGRITNADTIRWAEENDGVSDGFLTWRSNQNWVAGQHHRTGDFLTGEGTGGAGWGAQFKNLDFVAEASEWNHIGVRGDASVKNPNAAGDIDQPYFIGGLLDAIGSSWSEVKNLLETHPALAGKSYYDIIMTRSYTSLTAREATLFVAAMQESRERAWSMMSEVFGPVNLSRNDQAMMPYIANFISSHNPYGNHHAMAFFQLFLPIQHSVVNRMTTFYERGPTDGWEKSAMDDVRFWEFGHGMGADTYKSIHDGETDDSFSSPAVGGMLYNYRNQYSESAGNNSTRFNAVQNLIDGWFGAAYVENGRPIWEGYKSDAEAHSDGYEGVTGSWLSIPSTQVYGGGHWFNTTQAFLPDLDHPAYSWDRKWGSALFVKDGSEVLRVIPRCAGWADILNHLWSSGHISSRLNPTMQHMPHPHYISAQFDNLSYNGLMAGPEFASNWPVFANGMLMKWGQGLDLVKVMEKAANTRVASARFKQDKSDYQRRKEELEDEKKLEEKNAQKNIAKTKKWYKKLLQRAKRHRREATGQANTASRRRWNSPNEAKFGSKAYQQRLTKSSQRLLKNSKKHKAMLDKIRKQNQS